MKQNLKQIFIVLAAILFLILPLPVAIIIGILAIAFFIIQYKNEPTENSIIPGAVGVIFAVAGLGIMSQGNQYFNIACVSFYLMSVSFIWYLLISQHKDKQEAEQAQQEQIEVMHHFLDDIRDDIRNDIKGTLQSELEKGLDNTSREIMNSIQHNMNQLMNTYSEYKSPEVIASLIDEEREKSDYEFQQQNKSLREDYENKLKLREQELKAKFNNQLTIIKDEAARENSKTAAAAYAEKEKQLQQDFQKTLANVKKQLQEEKGKLIKMQERRYNLFKKKRDKQLDDLYQQLQEVNAQKLDLEKRTKESEEELISIQQLLNEQNGVIDELEANQDIAPNDIVKNKEIRQVFIKALDEAQEELDIISPWMTRQVVNNFLIDKFQSMLEKGVRIKILYGIVNHSNNNVVDDIAPKTKKVVKVLKQRLGKYPNFAMKQTDTHAKLFLCDDKYYVISSFNILSYDGEGSRGELGEISYNKNLVQVYRKKYFEF